MTPIPPFIGENGVLVGVFEDTELTEDSVLREYSR